MTNFATLWSTNATDLTGLDSGTLSAALGTLPVTTTDFSGVAGLTAGLRDHTSFETANTKAKQPARPKGRTK